VGALHPFSENAQNRERGVEFLKLAKASVEGIGYNKAKTLYSVSAHQAETRKSLYEEFGLLYVPARTDQIVLSEIGRQLLDLLGTDPTSDPSNELRTQVDTLLSWALSNTQINRPQSRGSPRPASTEWKTCNIRPYSAFWQAMRDLGGEITLQEFFGELWHLHKAEHYQETISRIQHARETGLPLINPALYEGRGPLMNPRIYWRSHLCVGEAVLVFDNSSGRFKFKPEGRRIVDAILDFHMGCAGDREAAFLSRPYSDVHEYYNIAGRACPPFLASARFKVTDVHGSRVVLLDGYEVHEQGTSYVLDGGPELCKLLLKAQCFHAQVPGHLLRIDAKEEGRNGSVRLLMGAGRIISDPTEFFNAFDQ
jgi:hypothetical protein